MSKYFVGKSGLTKVTKKAKDSYERDKIFLRVISEIFSFSNGTSMERNKYHGFKLHEDNKRNKIQYKQKQDLS